jgi:S-(hydroxymethyl)glutathione dehydrogenase / alcohol dehydrogenase
MQIRAAVLEEFANPLVVQDVELQGPGAGEVLVRLAACGVCHTDLYTAGGADPSGYAPTVLGHEGSGVVEEVGEGVPRVHPLPVRPHQSVPRHPRAAEQGLPARR